MDIRSVRVLLFIHDYCYDRSAEESMAGKVSARSRTLFYRFAFSRVRLFTNFSLADGIEYNGWFIITVKRIRITQQLTTLTIE